MICSRFAHLVPLLFLTACVLQAAAQGDTPVLVQPGSQNRQGVVPAGTAVRFGPESQVNSVESPFCGYGPLSLGAWPKQYVAAVSSVNTLSTGFPMEGCGACLLVVCTDPRPGVCKTPSPPFNASDAEISFGSAPGEGSLSSSSRALLVQVVDRCTTCGPEGIALHAGAFDQIITAPQTGGVAVSYVRVACRPPGNMRLRIVELRRTDGGYIKLVINNVNGFGQLVAVELARAGLQDSKQFGFPVSGEIWRRCDNAVGAYWEYSGLPANGAALDMRITDATGQVVNIRSAIPANATAGDFPLAGQFR